MKNDEKFALQIEYGYGPSLVIYRVQSQDRYTLVAEYDIDINKLISLTHRKYKELATANSDNHWVYMSERQVNFLLKKLGHNPISDIVCEICKGSGFIPLATFYTGCPECNMDQRGRFTLGELTKMIQND